MTYLGSGKGSDAIKTKSRSNQTLTFPEWTLVGLNQIRVDKDQNQLFISPQNQSKVNHLTDTKVAHKSDPDRTPF